MAVTLAEFNTMLNDPDLKTRVASACVKTATSVAFEGGGAANHVARLAWANRAYADPAGQALLVVRYVLAAVVVNDAGKTLADLRNLDDATIQANVDASLAVFAI